MVFFCFWKGFLKTHTLSQYYELFLGAFLHATRLTRVPNQNKRDVSGTAGGKLKLLTWVSFRRVFLPFTISGASCRLQHHSTGQPRYSACWSTSGTCNSLPLQLLLRITNPKARWIIRHPTEWSLGLLCVCFIVCVRVYMYV